MPTPQEKLDTMLNAYQATYKTSTTDPGKELRNLIETTPGLKDTFLDQINKGRLEHFVPLAVPGALGAYNAYDKTMAVSVDQLNSAAGGSVHTANSLRFTLGHEIDHAVTRDARLAEDTKLNASIQTIATGPSPHDYTATLKAYNESGRSREVGAEIAGFNALAGYVKSTNPHATLKDMFDASPNDMQMYVNVDLSKSPASYTPKPGLTVGSDLKMASSHENINAMGDYFYKKAGYPEMKIGYALSVINATERIALAAAQISDQSHPHSAPKIDVNLKELGVGAVPLPQGFDDTSPRLHSQTKAEPKALDPSSQPEPHKVKTGNPHVDKLLSSNMDDPVAFKQALKEMANSPAGLAFRAEGQAALEQQNRQLQTKAPEQPAQAPTQTGPGVAR